MKPASAYLKMEQTASNLLNGLKKSAYSNLRNHLTMLRNLQLIFTLLIGCLAFPLIADEEESTKRVDVQDLLSQWTGKWKGEVKAFSANGNVSSFQMELEIKPIPTPPNLQPQAEVSKDHLPARFVWKITYSGAQGDSIRNYELVPLDAAKRQFEIDEKNGIRIPATLLGDSLVSHFTVGEQTLWTSYRLADNAKQIEFEVISAANQNASTTKGEGFEVVSLKPSSRQFAKLEKVQ